MPAVGGVVVRSSRGEGREHAVAEPVLRAGGDGAVAGPSVANAPMHLYWRRSVLLVFLVLFLGHSFTFLVSRPLSATACRDGFRYTNPYYLPVRRSSGPSRSNDTDEWLSYSLPGTVAVVTSFAVTPYTALWQPRSPTYAPHLVQLLFF
ncbi:unnamed protein product, partial [Phaeothamnion confervicola]